MTPALSPSIPLPQALSILCRADGTLQADLVVAVTLQTTAKNDFNLIAGPSDANGKIYLTQGEMKSEVQRSADAFPADYAGLSAFSGVIVVSPLDHVHLEAALDAYDLYQAAIPYTADYRTKLEKAWMTLSRMLPKRLDVEVQMPYPATGVRLLVQHVASP